MNRLAFPFAVGPSGRIDSVDYGSEAQVRQMLELLIFTIVGERVMRSDFGSPVVQMVFAAGNGPVAIALEATLQATITQWLGHVLDLTDLSVTFDNDMAALEILVAYQVRRTKAADTLTVRKGLG